MSKVKEVDLESEGTLLQPVLNHGEYKLRWGFIGKVSDILSDQILLSAIVFSVTVIYMLIINDLLRVLWPLHLYQDKQPHNRIFLGLFTVSISFTVGFNCANADGTIVLQALALTATVICSLIAYTFWASKKGKDFSNLMAFFFTCLFVLILTVVSQVFFPLWPTSHAIYGGIGVLIVTGYLIYDMDNMIECFT